MSQPALPQTSVLSNMLSHAVMSGSMMGGAIGNGENLVQEVQQRRRARRGGREGRRNWRRGNRGSRQRAWRRHRRHYDGINPGAFLALGIVGALAHRGMSESHAHSAMQRCANTYRSFEWDTGLYTTYGGEKRLCPYLR